jgi:hypothetical protein
MEGSAEETPVLTEKALLNSDEVQAKPWDMEHKEWK